MLYLTCLRISDFDEKQTDILRDEIKEHFSEKVNLKRKESVISKAVICYLVREKFNISDCYIDCDENGKPYFVNKALYFNISHSGEYVLCLCGDENVGCDIQLIKSCNERVVKRFFTSEEYKAITRSDCKELDFARLWTMKESILKYFGDGISGGLSTYDFSDFIKKDSFKAHGLCFNIFELSGYVISVCSQSGKISELNSDIEGILKLRKGDYNEYNQISKK